MKDTMTIRELATFLGIRLATAYGLIWDSTIQAVKQDGAWVVDRESAESYQTVRNIRRIRRAQTRSAADRRIIEIEAAVTA